MPLSWPEIRDRATQFQKRWKLDASEQAESQSFWAEFLHIFDVDRKKVAVFEKQVQMKRAGQRVKNGRIDLFWPGTLLVEMKSAGQDLDRAFEQAADYFDSLPKRDLPRYILVSDFQRFRLFDLQEGIDHPEFTLDKLRDNIKRFGFVAGYQVQAIKPQDPVNERAALRMGALHDALKASGYSGHALEVLLVRLLFCLFADDTGIFTPAQSFRDWIESDTKEDGTDLGARLSEFFDVLNTAEDKRQTTQKENFKSFPYINGKLFEETLRPPAFNSKTRELLLEACAVEWSTISPAIFGALFQSIMDDKARRNLGAHYTSEENILKLIKPLFLDELWQEFERVKNNRNRLLEFHKRLRHLTFFDPACGCGNFLVITYRELRKLELQVLRTAYADGQQMLNVHTFINVDVDQFYGIEIEEFPAQIAQVALWLTDHQMNSRVSDEFGAYFARIPLKSSATVVHGNALRVGWESVLPAERCSYVLGNPPFVGKHYQSDIQKADLAPLITSLKSGGVLDYVAGWYLNAALYIQQTEIKCAFVSTNSITQGEQVGVLWSWLLAQGIHIHFAHRTFRWSNEASGKAAVHCVIIGFATWDAPSKTVFEYDRVNGDPHAVIAANINPYLVDAPTVLLSKRSTPLRNVSPMKYGSKPVDGGHFLFNKDEATEFLEREPQAKQLMRQFMGADELLYSIERYCLWLKNATPQQLRLPSIKTRIEAVKRFRLASVKVATQKDAAFPSLFTEDRQPTSQYLALPEVSGEQRDYFPIAYLPEGVVASNKLYTIADATLYEFGILSSSMHFSWMSHTSGRLKSDFQYSASLTYNNYPWPDLPSPQPSPASGRGSEDKLREAIEAAAQGVLDARAAHPQSSLADLYDPLTMPPNLVKAHQKLDAAVDAAYAKSSGKKSYKNDAERVAFLFTLYQQYTSLLPIDKPTRPKRRRTA